MPKTLREGQIRLSKKRTERVHTFRRVRIGG